MYCQTVADACAPAVSQTKGIFMPRRVINQALSASVILTTLMLAAGLSGCGKTESSASLMAEAKQYQQKGDNKAALIQLKNAATKSPEDAEVRQQLAVLYNQIANPVSAEKEIRKAISLGADKARAAPELAKALILQGKAQKAIDETEAVAANAGAELLATRGDAYLSLNQSGKAKESFEKALTARPGLTSALVGMARVAMASKDTEAASRFMEQATSANPKDATAWFFEGALMRELGKTDQALAAFSEAIKLKPDHINARIERTSMEIAAGKFDLAEADLDAARKLAPNSLPVLYSQAVLDFTQGKHAAAHESLLKVLSGAPDYMPAILLSGAVEIHLGTLQQAEQHLRKYLEKNPDNAYARKLLAQALLRSSQPADAVATLFPLLKDGTQDAQVLALAGESSMQTRDFKKATQYFEKASALAPNTAALHTSLGLSKLGQGQQELAVNELERATEIDPKSAQAGVALVRTELSLKRYDKALVAANKLVAAQPGNPMMHILQGGAYLGKGDRAGARASFERASTLQSGYYPAVANLAQLDIQDKKPDAAKQRLVAFLEKNKKNATAMTALAGLALAQKQPAEATTWLEKANAENPEAIAPAAQLAMHYLQTNQQQKALTLVRKMQTANPANADLLDLLGQAQIANNDTAGALETFSKLVSVAPKSPAAQLRLASVHLRLKNEPAATAEVKKALAMDPQFVPAKLLQIDLAMANGRNDEALALAREIQKSNGGSAVGYTLEGSIFIVQKKPELAIRPFEQAFAIAKTTPNLLKVVVALNASGKASAADARIAQWQQSHPADPLLAMFMGESYLANKQYKPAIDQFEAVLKVTPDNLAVLNNLALAYQEQKDPRALDTSERALKLAPNSAAVLDTVGWILVQQGNVTRGLPLLQKAVALQPASTELRFHLAVALDKSGDKKLARQELNTLLSNNKPFPQIDEAKSLLKLL